MRHPTQVQPQNLTSLSLPDAEDYEAIERKSGALRNDATTTQIAERYGLAQAHKLMRAARERRLLEGL